MPHCLWVSGRFAGQGHGRALLESALEDAAHRGAHGLCAIAFERKHPFLSDPKFLRHLGFVEVGGGIVFRYGVGERRVSDDRFRTETMAGDRAR